jgi:hypothetical protein
LLTHVLISLLGAAIFLRIVGKEKNRRYRHLLLRLEAAKQRQAEAQKQREDLLQTASAEAASDDAPAQTFDPIGQAA